MLDGRALTDQLHAQYGSIGGQQLEYLQQRGATVIQAPDRRERWGERDEQLDALLGRGAVVGQEPQRRRKPPRCGARR